MPVRASISRRQLLKGQSRPPPFRPRPPGVGPETIDACTRCGQCVDACPEQVLTLASDGVALVPEAGECTFCGACAEACPEPVFGDTGHTAHRADITDDCLTHAGIACMTCRDTCPEAAITMQPRIGGPFLPRLEAASCTGCGACIAACPADAIRAVPLEHADA